MLSYFFSVIKGTGELDRQQQNNTSSLDTNKILEGCPYLLLDVRDKDAYDQCHIISGRHLFFYLLLLRVFITCLGQKCFIRRFTGFFFFQIEGRGN